MHGGEAPGREMHSGPQWEHAGPVCLRDDRGGSWEVAPKNKNPMTIKQQRGPPVPLPEISGRRIQSMKVWKQASPRFLKKVL
jgi:hypothetical protein